MNRLLLFAKRPRLGKVKTRLCPPLRAEQALELYRAFLADQLDFLRVAAADGQAEICLDGAADPRRDPPLPGVRVSLQGPGDLGDRMLRAFGRSAADGCTETVVVGADSPTLPVRLVARAFERLRGGACAVVAPSLDGGYVLLGLREPRPELFRDLPWGTPAILELTRERANAAGLRIELLPPWYDVDDGYGLKMLERELRRPAASRRAPATARFLAQHMVRTEPRGPADAC